MGAAISIHVKKQEGEYKVFQRAIYLEQCQGCTYLLVVSCIQARVREQKEREREREIASARLLWLLPEFYCIIYTLRDYILPPHQVNDLLSITTKAWFWHHHHHLSLSLSMNCFVYFFRVT
jgi:hypothetical protein